MKKTVEERLDALERSNRRWRLLCGGLALGVSFVLLSGQGRLPSQQVMSPPTVRMLLEHSFVSNKVVTAGQFRLVDKQGRVRAVIGVKDSGDAGIYIFNENGHSLARLSGWGNRPDLHLDGAEGDSASLNIADRVPRLVLSRSFGRGARVWLGAEDPIPHFKLIDRLGRVIHKAPKIP